jgi:hypothetical protein
MCFISFSCPTPAISPLVIYPMDFKLWLGANEGEPRNVHKYMNVGSVFAVAQKGHGQAEPLRKAKGIDV